MEDIASIERRASHVKLLLMDCDGVLTDGSITLIDGDEQKTFNVRDGHGIVMLHRAGLQSGIISGRTSSCVLRRASELGMKSDLVCQGSVNKVKDFEELLLRTKIRADEVAYIGDDVNDIPLMRRAEFSVAVADSAAETLFAAHYVTRAPGGRGAVREVAELILRAQGHWSSLIEPYLES
ncbi:MAG TPA: HAD hydrolase family protein [Pyrinomonadaceae bacterium]|jgi:3-deoxy-D-manno-octulosonate 8-phosphate phosphatase (KDO 8-P phosphatase)|nr:HAD hydrolase family protein [Pyrinomonadaceae bacterium]